MTIADNEKTAVEVRKYPYLYDKSNSSYKENLPKINAWKEIDKSMDKPDGTAQRKWELLLNRYSKRRSNFKKVNVSGAKASDVTKALKSLEEYNFLKWIDGFIRQKNSKSNVLVSQIDENNDEEEGNDEEETFEEQLEDSSFELVQEKALPVKKRCLTQEDMFAQVSNYLKERMTKKQTSRSNDPDDIFGKMVSSELRAFPDNIKFMVNREINQVIYKHHNLLLYQPPTSTFHLTPATPSPNWAIEPQASTCSSTSNADLPPAIFN